MSCETLNSGKDIRPDTGLPQKEECIYEMLELQKHKLEQTANKGGIRPEARGHQVAFEVGQTLGKALARNSAAARRRIFG